MPSISVVIPVYNGAEFLRDSLGSVLNQTYDNIEIIVVDDASTDESKLIIQELAGLDSRIIPIYLEKNCGSFVARKRAVEAASSNYLLFVDCDDSLVLNACKAVQNTIRANPLDIIQFGENVIRVGDASDEDHSAIVDFAIPHDGVLSGNNLAMDCFVSRRFSWALHGKAIKTSLLKQAFATMPDERLILSEDVYIVFVLLYFAKSYLGIRDIIIYNYYWGRGITGQQKSNLRKFEEICTETQIVERLQEFVNSKNVSDRYQSVINVITQRFVDACIDAWNAFNADERSKAATLAADTLAYYAGLQSQKLAKLNGQLMTLKATSPLRALFRALKNPS